MSGRWDQPRIPHKGWRCIAVADLEDGASAGEEIDYATCEMCGNERIRFVHTMEHEDYEETLAVGCICAGKMSGDYVGTRQREDLLKKRAGRRARWLNRRWKVSTKGNPYLNADGHNVVVFHLWQAPNRWTYSVDAEMSQRVYPSQVAAKLAAFDEFWELIRDTID